MIRGEKENSKKGGGNLPVFEPTCCFVLINADGVNGLGAELSGNPQEHKALTTQV